MRTYRQGRAARPVLLAALIALCAAPAAAQTVAPQGAATPPLAAAPNGVGSAFELTFWQSVTGSEDIGSYEAYLARYPDGTFSGLARARIAAIQRALAVQPAAAAPAPAPAVAPAPAPQPAPAVLTMQQGAAPLAPTPAVAVAQQSPAPPAAEMTPAAAPVALAEAAPSPLARLLAQLRGSGDAAAQAAPAAQPEAAPRITPAPPVQPLPATAPGLASTAPAATGPAASSPAASSPAASGLVAAAPAQPVYAPAPAAPTAALTPAATPAVSYASGRPLLLPVPDVALPAYFCSNDARNAFHNDAYRPAVEVATRNNEAAVAYLRQLQQTYDRGQLGRDTAALNAIAAEARAYQSEAARAYSVQAALVRQFDALMAVPLRTCAPPVP